MRRTDSILEAGANLSFIVDDATGAVMDCQEVRRPPIATQSISVSGRLSGSLIPASLPMRVSAILLAVAALSPPFQVSSRVRTASGLVEGTVGERPGVRAFLGVPYAAPPIGSRRWKAPEAHEPWAGIRQADHFGPRCIQTRQIATTWRSTTEDEDCLHLSIWTPAKNAGEALPVMVWIHGSAFRAGSSDEARYDGSSLAARGVVVVGINYRLGLFGFLAHPELTAESPQKVSGNYAFLDQIAALLWVNKNIAAFGGDPRNVTIFGQSAGSSAVSLLMTSPLATGLFHRAIGQSPTNVFSVRTSPWLTRDRAEKQGLDLVSSLGARTVAELRTRPASELRMPVDRVPFPILDGHFLTEDPWFSYASGRQQHVPLLGGWTSAEIKSDPTTALALRKRLQAQFPEDFAAAQEVFPSHDDQSATLSATALSSAGAFSYHAWRWLEFHTSTGNAAVYRYLFAHEESPTTPDQAGPSGAAHEADIEYVFDTLDARPAQPRPEDRALANVMGAYWTNFAKSGSPNGAGLPAWPAFGNEVPRFVMRFGQVVAPEAEPDRPRYEFLDAVEHRRRGIP